MHPRDDTTCEKEQFPSTSSVSTPVADQETRPQKDTELHEPVVESDTYTAEEEALIQERLKNLGYL